MSTKERDFVVVRRINSFDTAAVLELISQIPSSEDLVKSSCTQFTR